MPRKPGSGGTRQGAPGQSYANRTDLNQNRTQPIRVAPAANYGDATRDRQAQQAIPLPTMAPPTPLAAPTQNPNEPLTAGMAQGPGAGPEAVQAPAGLTTDDNLEATIRGMFQRFPNSDLERLVAELSARRSSVQLPSNSGSTSRPPPRPQPTMPPQDLARLHQLQQNHPKGDVTVSWDQHGGFIFHLPNGRAIPAPSGVPPVHV